MTRQANAEIERLTADARQMRSLLASEHPDAIQAMALAQRVYTAQRTGTAAHRDRPPRRLSPRAETLAQYAAGGVERETAIVVLNAALERLKALGAPAAAAPAEGSNLRDARAGPPHRRLRNTGKSGRVRPHGAADRRRRAALAPVGGGTAA